MAVTACSWLRQLVHSCDSLFMAVTACFVSYCWSVELAVSCRKNTASENRITRSLNWLLQRLRFGQVLQSGLEGPKKERKVRAQPDVDCQLSRRFWTYLILQNVFLRKCSEHWGLIWQRTCSSSVASADFNSSPSWRNIKIFALSGAYVLHLTHHQI
jgi:hypothetical protein